jgi:DNA repair protein RadC
MDNTTPQEFMATAQLELIYRTTLPASLRPTATDTDEIFALFLRSWDLGKIGLVEEFKIMLLDTYHRVLGIAHLSTGTGSAVSVDIKHIVAAAILGNAESVVLCHNHPAEILEPSGQDKWATATVQEALRLMDINLLDHLVISQYDYFSFKNEGLL